MTDWPVVWLGVIAVSVAIMAAVQIGLIIVGIQVAKRATAAIDELRKEIKPLVDKLHQVADEAAKAASLAAIQVERVDRMLATTTERIEQVAGFVQTAFGGPVQKGAAIVLAFKAVLAMIRNWKSRGATSPRDDEDALFVG